MSNFGRFETQTLIGEGEVARVYRAIDRQTGHVAAPEQYKGMVSPLVDVYTLGATLHYLATRIDPRKERPFTFTPPRTINPQIPKSLAAVIMKALTYEPEDRWQSAEDFKAALLACL
jgi:serine/threonine-protein kinase